MTSSTQFASSNHLNGWVSCKRRQTVKGSTSNVDCRNSGVLNDNVQPCAEWSILKLKGRPAIFGTSSRGLCMKPYYSNRLGPEPVVTAAREIGSLASKMPVPNTRDIWRKAYYLIIGVMICVATSCSSNQDVEDPANDK